MEKSDSLKDLSKIVNSTWSLAKKHYDQPIGNTQEQRTNFGVRHVNLHLNKITGQLASVIEECEHSGEFDRAVLVETPRQLIINALKLAKILNVPTDYIVSEIEVWREKYSSY